MTAGGLAATGSRGLAAVAGLGLCAAVAALTLAMAPGVGGAALASLVLAWAQAGALACAYVAGAWGLAMPLERPLGRALGRELDDQELARWLTPALGLGIMLTLSHALGVLGLLGGVVGRAVALGTLGVGLVLLARGMLGRRTGAAGLHPAALSAIPALAVLVVASASPPGWLWASEGFGYDTLSYHLQLPNEWAADGRLWPLKHSVYSFLPGYVESAFLHLAVAVGVGPGVAIAGGDGVAVLAGQMLSALTAALAAVLIGRLGWAFVMMAGDREAAGGVAAACAGLALGTPWVLVTGSLAYNEPAVLAMGAGAMLAALGPLPQGGADGAAARIDAHAGVTAGTGGHALRWALAAALVGAACGAKPTALFLLTPPVGLVLLWRTPPKAWARAGAVAVAVGLVSLAPWMVRNELATGNPVFPALAGLFGPGHWTLEQHARWAGAHSFGGSAIERVRLLVLPDPAGQPVAGLSSMRGLLHPHWGLLGAVVLAGLVVVLAAARRGVAVVLAGGVVLQLAAWLLFTHLQSRFLLPLVIVGVPLVGVLAARLGRWRGGARAAVWVCVSLALAQNALGVWALARERGGRGALAIAAGTRAYTGEGLAVGNQAGELGPIAFVNRALPPGGGVLLAGGATPLYFTRPVRYATTWDAGVLADAIAAGAGPGRWSRRLAGEGVRFVLINHGELDRLGRSGWLAPELRGVGDGALVSMGEVVASWPGRTLVELAPPRPGR